MTMMHALIQERWDAYMRHCVAGVTQGGKPKARAFAICKAGGNKAGYYQPGTKRVTAKGKKAMRAHSRDTAAKGKDAAYEKAIKSEGTMTGMQQLIRRLEEATATWSPAQEAACLKAAQKQLATHGYHWKPRVDVSSSIIIVDAVIPGALDGRTGDLVVEVARVREDSRLQMSEMSAGASFQTGKKGTVKVVEMKTVPQTKETVWPPAAEAVGLEAGDMIAQVYEMSLEEGFVVHK